MSVTNHYVDILSIIFSDFLLLTPLCCDDIHDVTPRVSTLAGCDKGCIDTRKSTYGGIQFLGDKFVRWMSKKQDCTIMSSAEVEYVVLSASCAKTEYQLADMFNKALPKDRFKYLVRRIGMRYLILAELENCNDVLNNFLIDGPEYQSVEGVSPCTSVDHVDKRFNDEYNSIAVDGLFILKSQDVDHIYKKSFVIDDLEFKAKDNEEGYYSDSFLSTQQVRELINDFFDTPPIGPDFVQDFWFRQRISSTDTYSTTKDLVFDEWVASYKSDEMVIKVLFGSCFFFCPLDYPASTSKGKVVLGDFEDVANGKGKVVLDDFTDVGNGKAPLRLLINTSLLQTQEIYVNEKEIRIILGLAGIFQMDMNHKLNNINDAPTQEYVRKSIDDVSEADNFKRRSWITTLEFINDNKEIKGGCFGDIKSYLKKGKLEKIVAIITSHQMCLAI
nr:hypothetical protein [Tanacetum cinerariifolium]